MAAPTIQSIAPASSPPGTTFNAVLTGSGFTGATVSVSGDAATTVGGFIVVNDTTLQVTLLVAASATSVAQYNLTITVTTPGGTASTTVTVGGVSIVNTTVYTQPIITPGPGDILLLTDAQLTAYYSSLLWLYAMPIPATKAGNTLVVCVLAYGFLNITNFDRHPRPTLGGRTGAAVPASTSAVLGGPGFMWFENIPAGATEVIFPSDWMAGDPYPQIAVIWELSPSEPYTPVGTTKPFTFDNFFNERSYDGPTGGDNPPPPVPLTPGTAGHNQWSAGASWPSTHSFGYPIGIDGAGRVIAYEGLPYVLDVFDFSAGAPAGPTQVSWNVSPLPGRDTPNSINILTILGCDALGNVWVINSHEDNHVKGAVVQLQSYSSSSGAQLSSTEIVSGEAELTFTVSSATAAFFSVGGQAHMGLWTGIIGNPSVPVVLWTSITLQIYNVQSGAPVQVGSITFTIDATTFSNAIDSQVFYDGAGYLWMFEYKFQPSGENDIPPPNVQQPIGGILHKYSVPDYVEVASVTISNGPYCFIGDSCSGHVYVMHFDGSISDVDPATLVVTEHTGVGQDVSAASTGGEGIGRWWFQYSPTISNRLTYAMQNPIYGISTDPVTSQFFIGSPNMGADGEDALTRVQNFVAIDTLAPFADWGLSDVGTGATWIPAEQALFYWGGLPNPNSIPNNPLWFFELLYVKLAPFCAKTPPTPPPGGCNDYLGPIVTPATATAVGAPGVLCGGAILLSAVNLPALSQPQDNPTPPNDLAHPPPAPPNISGSCNWTVDCQITRFLPEIDVGFVPGFGTVARSQYSYGFFAASHLLTNGPGQVTFTICGLESQQYPVVVNTVCFVPKLPPLIATASEGDSTGAYWVAYQNTLMKNQINSLPDGTTTMTTTSIDISDITAQVGLVQHLRYRRGDNSLVLFGQYGIGLYNIDSDFRGAATGTTVAPLGPIDVLWTVVGGTLGYTATGYSTRILTSGLRYFGTQQPALTTPTYTLSDWVTNSITATAGESVTYDARDNSLWVATSDANFVYHVFLDRMSGAGVDVADVISWLCSQTDLVPSQYDTSAVAGLYFVGGIQLPHENIRDSLLKIMDVFQIDACESEGMIRFVPRNRPPQLVIDEEDLGSLESTGKTEPRIEEVLSNETDVPERISILYYDPARSYQQCLQYSKRISLPYGSGGVGYPHVTHSRTERVIATELTSDSNTMKRQTEKLLYEAWAQRFAYTFKTTLRFLVLDPSDIIAVNYKGVTLEMRLLSVDRGAGLSLQIKALSHDYQIYDSDAVSSPGGMEPST